MNKLLFATQVFSLMVMLPFVIILEMNHTKSGEFKSNSTPGFKQTTETISNSLPVRRNGKTGNEISLNTPENFLLLKAF